MDTHDSPEDAGLLITLRRGWQALSAGGRWGAGLPLLAVTGAGIGSVVGLGLGAVPAGALAGAAVALLAGPLSAWLSTPSPAVADDPPTTPLPPVAADPAPATRVAEAESAEVIRDALTGAFTQRHFITAVDREWSRIRRHGEDAALLMIDADHLHLVNSAHGTECGDAVLVQLTRLVNGTLRQYDLMARFNAGVLVVYLPHTDPIGAIDVAERIRDGIANYRMNWPTGPVAVTVSIGVAAIGADHAVLDAVISEAGTALREAKLAGRNCVRAAPVPPKRMPSAGQPLGDRRAH